METTRKIPFSHRVRKTFISVHRWIGLILGAWFVLVAVTGSLMAWRGEITGAEVRARYPVSRESAGMPVLTLAEADAALQKSYPFFTERDLASVTVPNRNMPHYAYQYGRRGRRLTFLVDAYTGTVHKPYNPRETFMGTVNQLHTRLISGFRGYVVNGSLAVFAVLLLLSGLYVWWPSKIDQLKSRLTVKRGISLNRTLYDTHNVLAISLYPVLITLAVTAPLMVGEHIVREGPEAFRRNWASVAEAGGGGAGGGERRAGGGERVAGNAQGEGRTGREARAEGGERRGEGGARAEAGAAGGGRGQSEGGRREGPALPKVAVAGERLADDELLRIAQESGLNGEITRLRRPTEPDQALQVTYVQTYGLSRSQSLYLDPYTGKVLAGVAPAPERESGFMRLVHQLHFGEYGGAISKTVYTVAGLLPLGLFITGVMLWARKRVRRSAAERETAGVTVVPGTLDLGTAGAAAASSEG